jgi:hypothetical protein
MTTWLVCGSRGKGYENTVHTVLDFLLAREREWQSEGGVPEHIIEGGCPNSADVYVEIWANMNRITVERYPGTDGNYLTRNIKMVKACDRVIAFWDGFSYGTAHTIAWAVRLKKPVQIYSVLKEVNDEDMKDERRPL